MIKKNSNRSMCIKSACLFAFASFILQVPAQVNDFSKDYTLLRSSGTIPEIFLKSAKEQTQQEVAKLKNDVDKKFKTQFITSNNHFIRDFLLSGQVLINDPLTAYVNNVATKVLEQNPEANAQPVQLFVTKSPEVNAYAFDKGFIFVNIGLLAQLENEAQLAYILAHEMIHINKKHSVTEYLKHKNSETIVASGRAEEDDEILAMYRFSKEQETEADISGLDLIKKTNYSITAVNGALDVLQYSYLPFELPEFKKAFFEDEYLKIPDTLNLKKVSSIKTNDDYDDTKSTHPNIRKRRLSMGDDVKLIPETGRKKYLVSEERFKSMREQARFELCRIYLLKRDYVNAIYAAYILLQKYPENCYLKKIVAKGLYNVALNKSGKSSDGGIRIGTSSSFSMYDYDKVEGASQRLYYLLDKLTSKELNVIALSYTYKASKQYPADKSLKILTDSLFSYLVNTNKLYLADFSKKSIEELKDTVKKPVVVQEEPQEESKYSTIKKLQEKEELVEESNFIKYALVGLLKDDEFVRRFKTMAKGREHEVEEEYVQKSFKKSKKKKQEDNYLGIDKVIFIDPYYRKVKTSGNDVIIKFDESDEKQEKLMSIQTECAGKLKLDYERVTTSNLTSSSMEQFNEVVLVNEWLAERFRYGDDDGFIECSEAMKELIAKKGSKYIALTGVYNKNKKSNSYLFMLLDLETGKVLRSELRSNRERDSNDLLHAYAYNSLFFVKKKKS